MSGETFDKRAAAAELSAILGDGRVLEDEPMSAHTTFRVGGPADLYAVPGTAEGLGRALAWLRAHDVPYFLLGKGSDLLVSDAGYRGVIVAVGDGLKGFSREGAELTFGAGVSLKDATDKALELGLGGLEFACGIPGSVGGACYMNAGAYGGQMADVLVRVRAIMPDGSVADVPAGELELGYRTSLIRTAGLVVVSATVGLEPRDPAEIAATMQDLTRRREEKQPLELGSAGSTFKRPEGHFAGKLITDAGCKGYRVGDAEVSTKHAGFVVNLGHATAADVHAVIEHVQEEVERQFGVRLECEVIFLG